MNLLARRNLLFQVVQAPSPRFPINIRIGTPEYSREEAADPNGFALRQAAIDGLESFPSYIGKGRNYLRAGNASQLALI